jgi:hypothetical protein
MADPVLGLGPNLQAYRNAFTRTVPSRQMSQMAHQVARTLHAAFHNVPFPLSEARNQRERNLLRLREAIERMVLDLDTAVKEGGFDGIEWPETGQTPESSHLRKQNRQDRIDQLELSVRSKQLSQISLEALQAMEDSLYLLNDSEAAQEIAWLAQAQVLHEAIVAFHAQANIDKVLAEKVLQAHTPIPMIVKFVQNKIAQRLDSSLLEDYED